MIKTNTHTINFDKTIKNCSGCVYKNRNFNNNNENSNVYYYYFDDVFIIVERKTTKTTTTTQEAGEETTVEYLVLINHTLGWVKEQVLLEFHKGSTNYFNKMIKKKSTQLESKRRTIQILKINYEAMLKKGS